MSMRTIRAVVRLIDSSSDWGGKTVRWVCVVLMVVMGYEIILRHVFGAPTMWAFETSIMLGAVIFSWSWAYAQRYQAHIRIDLIYIHLSPKQKAIIDVVGDLLIYLPIAIGLTYISAVWTWNAWEIGEVMVETYWYPPAAPLRTVVTMAFGLFALQGGAQLIRDLYLLITSKPYD